MEKKWRIQIYRRNKDFKHQRSSQDNKEHDSVVDKNGIHYGGKQDEYVKEYIDDDK